MTKTKTFKGAFQELPLADVIPTKHNKRHINPKDPKIIELAESIREKGVIQPVACRPHPTEVGKFELLAGNRRFVASGIAEQPTIPAVVRDLDDQSAVEITALENLQREDLEPLEEAEQVALLLGNGFDIEGAARAIGRTKQWVVSRAHVAKLIDGWKEAITNPPKPRWEPTDLSGIQNWSIGLLEEIAKAPETVQQSLLKYYQDQYYGGIPTVASVREKVADYTRELGKAPFDIEDPDLVKDMGPCTTCLQRRGAQPDLFGLVEVVSANKDTCLNGPCYQKKIIAHGRKKLKKAKAENPDTVELKPVQHTPWYNGRYVEADFSGRKGFYKKCKKTDKGALPAVVTGANGKGQTVHVKLVASKSAESHKTTIGDLRKELKSERLETAIEAMRAQVKKISLETAQKELGLDMPKLMSLAVVFGAHFGRSAQTFTGCLKKVDKMTPKRLEEVVWESVRDRLSYQVSSYAPGAKEIKESKAVCQMVGLSWDTIWKAACDKHPEPSEWKGLKASDVPPAKSKSKAA